MNFKHILSIVLVFALSFGICSFALADENSEFPEGYTPIYTAEDLNNIRNNLSGSYILMNDIDLSGYENWEPIGTSEAPFEGNLDGNGYVINGLNIQDTLSWENKHNVALFGNVSKSLLENIRMTDVDINVDWEGATESYYEFKAAALVADSESSEIRNCAVSGNISISGFERSYIGVISGYNSFSEIYSCSNYADITAALNDTGREAFVGGIAGHLDMFSAICESCNLGDISITGEESNAESYIGGIYGSSYSVYVSENLYNRGTVSTGSPNGYIGGISGDATILVNCYNSGEILTGDNFNGYTGGISGNLNQSMISTPGSSDYSRIENVYHIDKVKTPSCFNMEQFDDVSLEEKRFAFINVNCVTAEQMKQQDLYTTFDFDTVWTMEENGYPVLQNQPTLTVKESLDIEKGETYVPESFESWKSTDETVATVNEDGEIVALSAGTATVTIEHAYGFYTEYTITVTDSTVTPEPTPDPEPPTEPNEPTDPEPTCWLLKIINLIKKVLGVVVNTVKSFF